MIKTRILTCAALTLMALAAPRAEAQLGKLKEKLNKATKPAETAPCETSAPDGSVYAEGPDGNVFRLVK